MDNEYCGKCSECADNRVIYTREFGEAVRIFRNIRGVSLRTTASRTGVPLSTLSEYERKKSNGSLHYLNRVFKFLRITFHKVHELADHLREVRQIRAVFWREERNLCINGKLHRLTPAALQAIQLVIELARSDIVTRVIIPVLKAEKQRVQLLEQKELERKLNESKAQ